MFVISSQNKLLTNFEEEKLFDKKIFFLMKGIHVGYQIKQKPHTMPTYIYCEGLNYTQWEFI